MAEKRKVGVTTRALIQRINRKLKPDLEALKVSRGERMRFDLGEYYVIDYRLNAIQRHNVDPEALARELGVLRAWEEEVNE
jgi:hypothetical protein